MKIRKNEVKEIIKNFNLGSLVSIEKISNGWVNDNYKLKTSKGVFVIRGMNDEVRKKPLTSSSLSFRVLEHLKSSKFDYQVPEPLKNAEGSYLLRLKNKNFMVYEMIKGIVPERLNRTQLKSMIHGLAQYHKSMKKFPLKKIRDEVRLKGLKKKLDTINATKSKSKLNVLARENIGLIVNLFNKIKSKTFEKNILAVHMDFHRKNMVYKGNELMGILDFDNIIFAPRILDIAHLIKTSADYSKTKFSKEVEFIIKEYSSINYLTKSEKKDVLLILARDCCIMFEYFYSHKGYDCLLWTINTAKQVTKEIK
jgi:Ser/Thr protein kinase RdoA (MazF antagonist)